SIDPRNEAVLHRRGHAHFESGSYDRAVADYTAAVAVSKNKEHLYIDRAKAYLAGRKNELAIADYGRAISSNASSHNYKLRGSAYYDQKKYDLAVADFTSAIKAYEKN